MNIFHCIKLNEGVISMKSIKKALAGLLVAVTMVTPVFAKDLRLKQNPIPAYDADKQSAGYDLTDGQAAGTRTVYDIIIKDGTTFVNAEEFAQAMDLYLHKNPFNNKVFDSTFVLTTKILKNDIIPSDYWVEVYFELGKKDFTLSGLEPTQSLINGVYRDDTKPIFENHYLPAEIYEWSKYGLGPDKVSTTSRQGAFPAAPFEKNGKVYVPIKALVQALNVDQQTKIAYNSVNKSITFQKDFMYKHYVFNGTITDRNLYDWNASY